MEVSLIIPTYNKASRLALVLESLKKLEFKEGAEIVIVNDGSWDKTEELLNQFKSHVARKKDIGLQVISIRNSGRSCARNAGIQSARGKLLVFSDDDLILDPKFLYYHRMMHRGNARLAVHGQIYSLPYLKFFKNPVTGELYNGGMAKPNLLDKTIKPGMVPGDGFGEYLEQNSKISKFERDIKDLFENTSIEDSYVRWVGFTGGNVSVLKSNLEAAGLFDSNMGKEWGCEDLETGYRLYKNGICFEYCSRAKNYHLDHFRENRMEIHERSMSYFLGKHGDEKIKKLGKYFAGETPSLTDWKRDVDAVI